MEKILLIDGHSILSRAFFGIPRLTTGDGRPTNAVYGFMNILLKVFSQEKPDYLAAAFDLDRKKLFRTQKYPEYKGNRKPMPEELLLQVPVIQKLLEAMQIPVITCPGYEADDILGTLSLRASEEGMEVSVLSGDRDLLQLAGEHVTVLLPKTAKGETELFIYHPEEVKRDYLVTPTEFIDVKALMGDTSDNIPGLPGVGEKTATEIIQKFGSIENAQAHVEEIRPPRAQQAFRDHFDLAVLSKDLATIRRDAPVDADLRKGRCEGIYTSEALSILRDLELKKLSVLFSSRQTDKTPEDTNSFPDWTLTEDPFRAAVLFDDCANADEIGISWYYSEFSEVPVQLSLFENETLSGGFLAIGLCIPGQRFSVLKSGEKYRAEQLFLDFKKFIDSCTHRKVQIDLFDLKKALKNFEIPDRVLVFDTALASYLIDPNRGEYDYDTVAKDHLGLVLKSEKELLGKGESFSAEALAFRAYCAVHATGVCKKKLKELGMEQLYNQVELPLSKTIAEMEAAGIRADREALRNCSLKLTAQSRKCEERIYELSGERFNINSPIQLGTVLFEKMGLPGGKKTKKGYSTAADVLEKLAGEHEIVGEILTYRKLTKLNSTYAEGLAAYIGEDERIHGTFHQTVTATGRLSSADPNLQNIPVRTEEGREIRKVFIPAEGYVFLDADYSQVELRILASLSGDENLIRAYRESEDIHTATAAKVFHVPLEKVTPEMRRNAKAVNFGIVYGISAFGLGEGLSISRKEALSYINTYFETYPKVKAYLDGQVKIAKETGMVRTYFGRIRPIPELKSSNFMERSFGERIAMNSPIQGTAADIIKIAMNRVRERLIGMKTRIVLQIHDELLLETVPEEMEAAERILKEEMEGAAQLKVPLSVEVHSGYNWNEAH